MLTTSSSLPSLSTILRGFFYPILLRSQLGSGALKKTSLDSDPLVLFRNPMTHSVIVHSDICPHQGASLAKGWLTSDGTLMCPYHGFAFQNGVFCGIPDPSAKKHKCRPRPNAVALPLLETSEDADFVYAAFPPLNGPTAMEKPYQPPEATDPSFTRISGARIIQRPQAMVTENILDNLHLAYVHTFGNRDSPLPKAIRYEPLGLTGGRSHFVYKPRPGTLFTWLGGGETVLVENEFHLPTCTLTRVLVGDSVKTVVTRAQPLDQHSCVLYWTVYRNFYTAPIFDGAMRAMMDRTLDEDVGMLRNVYPNVPQQIAVGYDVTILEYRKAVRLFLEQQDTTY